MKKDVFDAIVGYDGAAPVSGWERMSYDELVEQAAAQDELYYGDTLKKPDYEQIAAACKAYRAAESQDAASRVRATLGLSHDSNA